MKRKSFFIILLIAALLVTTLHFVELASSLASDTSEGDNSRIAQRDAATGRAPVESDVMPLLLILFGEAVVLYAGAYLDAAAAFLFSGYLSADAFHIRPPPVGTDVSCA